MVTLILNANTKGVQQ